MEFRSDALRSKVGRKFLLLFVGCALLPIAILSVLTYRHVTGELYRQSERRLHRSSKATGMAVLGRLLSLEAELSALRNERGGDDRDAPGSPALHFRSVAFVDGSGAPVPLHGPALAPPTLSAGEQAHVADGGTLVATRRDPQGRLRSYMVRRPAGDSPATAIGEIDLDFLLDRARENSLPPSVELCLLDDEQRVIGCSLPGVVSLPDAAKARVGSASSGGFEWSHAGEEYIAYHWTIFLKPNFLVPHWSVVLGEPKAAVLAPVESFRAIFPLVIALSVLLVSLLSLSQIRRRLVPLQRLQEGTRRIAMRDFDVEIAVEGSDELADLAASFNTMASQVREQFDSLSKMIDIDRAILSANDVGSVMSAVLNRLGELYSCDLVAMSLVEAEEGDGLRTFYRRAGTAGIDRSELDPLTPADVDCLCAEPEIRTVDLEREVPCYLQPLADAGMRLAFVLPLFVNQQLAGLIALGHGVPRVPRPDRLVYARQLADQAAIALANARTLEENRVLAYYDSLTGLPNRLLFKERLGQTLGARDQRQRVATCLLDLDGFKRINDTLGHDAGDQLLRQVADRLSSCARNGTLARLGGDEFAIILRDLTRIEDAARVAERLLEGLSRPFRLGSHEVFITASIGIAIHPDDGESIDSLVKNADTAMYHAKDNGRNNYQFYSRSMNDTAIEHMRLENDLRRALERDELRTFYQPVVDVSTRDVVGVEALVRWQHPRLGLVPPVDFIPVAEQTGLIVPIGEWILRTACAQTATWHQAGFMDLSVAVNLSPRQFREESLVASVRRAQEAAGLAPRHLVLELTESLLMKPERRTMQSLVELRNLGVRVSIDDFGTGYASLSYLKHFPVDVLKIDRSFIRNLESDPGNAAIAEAVITMGHSMNLAVVAEGVETEAQLAFLRERNCDSAQGYLFGAPMPADDITKLLSQDV